MFYVKETIGDTTEINIEINDENVFCRGPVCGREVLVDLEEVLGDGKGDLFGTSVMCKDCSRKVMELKHGKPEA